MVYGWRYWRVSLFLFLLKWQPFCASGTPTSFCAPLPRVSGGASPHILHRLSYFQVNNTGAARSKLDAALHGRAKPFITYGRTILADMTQWKNRASYRRPSVSRRFGLPDGGHRHQPQPTGIPFQALLLEPTERALVIWAWKTHPARYYRGDRSVSRFSVRLRRFGGQGARYSGIGRRLRWSIFCCSAPRKVHLFPYTLNRESGGITKVTSVSRPCSTVPHLRAAQPIHDRAMLKPFTNIGRNSDSESAKRRFSIASGTHQIAITGVIRWSRRSCMT